MARPCKCCNHPDRAALDAALVGGESIEVVSKRTGITKQSVWRHLQAHLPKADIQAGKQALAEAEGERGATLLEQAQSLLGKARDLLQKAEAGGDIQTALRGVREARECLNFIAKLSGDVNDGINIIINPQFVSLQAVIVAALAPYPDARRAVVEALAVHGCGE